MSSDLQKVMTHGFALRKIKCQTLEICLEAVKNKGNAIRYVNSEFLTNVVCMEAIKSNPYAIRYIDDKLKTFEICDLAVTSNGWTLKYIPNTIKKYDELCKKAVEFRSNVLKDIGEKYQTKKMCIDAVKNFGPALRYVKNKDLEICYEAVKQSPLAIKYVDPELFLALMEMLNKSKCVIYEDLETLGNEKMYTEDVYVEIIAFIRNRFGSTILEVTSDNYLDTVKNNKDIKNCIIIKKERELLYEIYKKESTRVNNGWLMNSFVEEQCIKKVGRFLIC